MSYLDWLAVVVVLQAMALPVAVAFGISIGRMRERDSKEP